MDKEFIEKDTLGFFRKRPETVKAERLYEYITLRRTKFSVHAMCRVLKVSESGYYHQIFHAYKPRFRPLLLVKIKQIIAQHPDNGNYGVGHVRLALEQGGVIVSKSTVRRAVKKAVLLRLHRKNITDI